MRRARRCRTAGCTRATSAGWTREGRLYITGRKKEIIVLSSGKNLYPEEIEAHYRQSAFIKELCVLGLSRPGEPSAERLHAVVVPDEDVMRAKGIVNLKELLRFEIEGLSVQLPAHKRILSYDISMEPLPRTTTGKIRRHEIQRRLREHASDGRRGDEARRRRRTRRGPPSRTHAAALDVIARRLERAGVRPDANLELDLGLDSMERVELLTLLEQRQGTRVAADARATIFTVRQLDRRRGGGAAHGRSRRTPRPPPIRRRSAVGHAARRAGRSGDHGESGAAAGRFARSVLFVVIKTVAPGRAACVRDSGARASSICRREGPYILSPNHQAYLDPFFLAAALPYPRVPRICSSSARRSISKRRSRAGSRARSI